MDSLFLCIYHRIGTLVLGRHDGRGLRVEIKMEERRKACDFFCDILFYYFVLLRLDVDTIMAVILRLLTD